MFVIKKATLIVGKRWDVTSQTLHLTSPSHKLLGKESQVQNNLLENRCFRVIVYVDGDFGHYKLTTQCMCIHEQSSALLPGFVV